MDVKPETYDTYGGATDLQSSYIFYLIKMAMCTEKKIISSIKVVKKTQKCLQVMSPPNKALLQYLLLTRLLKILESSTDPFPSSDSNSSSEVPPVSSF